MLKQQLKKVEKLAKGSKLQRFLAHPFKYSYGIFFSKIVYPITKKGVFKTTSTFFGDEMSVVLPAGLDIYLTGGKTHDSETNLARLMLNQLSEGDTFVDIGAHYGYFSLLASKIVGEKGKVFSYEASKNTFEILGKNIANHLNIKAFHNALSDKNGSISFFEFPVLFSEYNSLDIKQFENQKWFKKYPPQKIEVEATTLSELVEKNNLVPKMIKIDVEGAEEAVMLGAKQFLAAQSTLIIMEYLAAERGNEPHVAAEKILQNAGFKPYFIDHQGVLQFCENVEAFLKSKNYDSDNIVFKK
jgi:FkbM family methyltransferase